MDSSVPGVNEYADNVCVGFGIAGSDPPDLCDDDPIVAEDTPDTTGDVNSETDDPASPSE